MNEQEMREVFALFDKDGDGCITSSELMTVMCSLGIQATDQEAKNMIRRVDTDGNGLLDFQEFLHMMESYASTVQRHSPNTEMRAMFAAFDKDGNGYIDSSELKSTMHDVGLELTERDIDEMMKVAGVEIKDRIFYEDFVKMMMGNIGAAQGQGVGDTQQPVKAIHSLGYVAEDMETQELRIAFSMFDKDGDGQITAQEVQDTMRSLGIHVEPNQIQLIVKKVDTDGDGTISFAEFRQVLEKYRSRKTTAIPGEPGHHRQTDDKRSVSEMDLRETFRIFDKDQDGFLNAADLRDTMKQLGLVLNGDDIHAMMRSIGVGPLGKICFKDFCKIFNASSGEQRSEMETKCSREDFSQFYSRKRLSNSYSAHQKAELQAVFSLFDKDCDGYISVEEVEMVLTSMGINPSMEFIREMFQQVDLDGNGKIDFQEFLLLVKKYERPLSEEREIREMFDMIDADRNGFIDAEELKSTFAGLGVPLSNSDIKDMLKEANIQGSRIFYEDFVQIMTSNIGAAHKRQLAQFPCRSASATPIGSVTSVVEQPQSRQQSSTLPATNAVADSDDAELKELCIQFAQFDKDGDGVISSTELCQVMSSLGLIVSLDAIQKVLQRASLDGNDHISFTDFRKIMSHYKRCGEFEKQLQEQDIRHVFRVFDKNRDGHIDENELRQTMKDLGMTLSGSDISAMMKKAGCKIAGRIYYEEFVKIVFSEMLNPSSKVNLRTESDEFMQDLARLGINRQVLSLCSAIVCVGKVVQLDERELRVAFALVDKDGDGRITPRELLAVMTSLGFKSDDAVIKQMISCFDSNGNGTLEFDEFRDMMKATVDGTTRWERLKRAHTPPDTWKAFKVFDRNGDGYISKTELYQTMKELGVRLSMDDLNEMMRAADINQDGKIDYAEFSKLMTGAFTSFAKQAAQLHEQKTQLEVAFHQRLTPADLQQAFESVDVDKDGVISTAELQLVTSSLGINITRSQAEAMMLRVTKNDSGKMTLSEFMMALHRADDPTARKRPSHRTSNSGKDAVQPTDDMHTAFRVFDANNDGFIDASELRATMSDLTGDVLTDADVSAMIRSADRNGDGRIDYEEFVEMMHTK